jgi:hypothetical protein
MKEILNPGVRVTHLATTVEAISPVSALEWQVPENGQWRECGGPDTDRLARLLRAIVIRVTRRSGLEFVHRQIFQWHTGASLAWR